MARITIEDGDLVIHIEGIDRFLALRGTLRVPLPHIRAVTARPDVNIGWSALRQEMKIAGTDVPYIMRAGSFIHFGEGRYFYDVHDPKQCIAIDLEDEQYKRIVVQVDGETPEHAADRIEAARAGA